MKEEIIDFKHFIEENKIVVVKRIKSNRSYLTHPPRPVPDKVWKEVWGVQDGILTLLEQIEGTHEPEHTVKEKFIFEDGKEQIQEVIHV